MRLSHLKVQAGERLRAGKAVHALASWALIAAPIFFRKFFPCWRCPHAHTQTLTHTHSETLYACLSIVAHRAFGTWVHSFQKLTHQNPQSTGNLTVFRREETETETFTPEPCATKHRPPVLPPGPRCRLSTVFNSLCSRFSSRSSSSCA